MKKIFVLIILFLNLYSQIIWGPERRITHDTLNPWSPRAAVWGDTIHLVWQNLRYPHDIFYMRSIDKGETWEEPKNLTINDPDDAWSPWITCWGNKIHVVYKDGYADSIMYVRSLDGGNNWENPRKLIKPGRPFDIICRHDTIFLIGVTGYYPSNFFMMMKSFNGGNTWTPPQMIDSAIHGQRLGLSTNYLHISALGYTQTCEIFYFRSPDLGNTWEGPFLISPDDNRPSQVPTMSVSGSSVYIAWCDYASFFTDYIFERHSHDYGNSFSHYQNLAPLGRAQESEIYTNGEFVILVWEDNRINGGVDFDLFWRASFDGGKPGSTKLF